MSRETDELAEAAKYEIRKRDAEIERLREGNPYHDHELALNICRALNVLDDTLHINAVVRVIEEWRKSRVDEQNADGRKK